MKYAKTVILVILLAGQSLWAESFQRVDICVYGSSPAAITAAIEASRTGAKVLLVSPTPHIGGILANGLGSNDLDNHDFKNSVALGGLAKEFFERVGSRYGQPSVYRFEASVAEAVFDEWLSEHRITVLRGWRLREDDKAVAYEDGRIIGLRFENGGFIKAKYYIDGTVEGDLIARAGIDYTWGREANTLYGETLNGIRNVNTYRQFTVSVDPYKIPGDVSSGTIPGIQDEPYGTPGDGDQRIMGFCFRLVLTRNAGNRIPIQKPEDYDVAQYEIYLRYFAAGGASSFFSPVARIPNGKTDVGSWHDLSLNLYGENHGYPDGTYAEREQILAHHRSLSLGLIWFLQNDSRIPDSVRNAWSGWGLPADEFADNGNWPRELYVRSARRMVSDYIITEHDLTRNSGIVANDPVAVAFWPPDMHHARRVVRNGKAYNEGFVFGGIDWQPFGISYRSLVPKREQCLNLLAPACLSSSYVAYGAIRLEWTFMSLGQASGAAAAIALALDVPVQDVPYAELKNQLLHHQQILDLNPEASPEVNVIDNLDTDQVEIIGNWIVSSHISGYIGSNYLHDGNTDKCDKSVIFRPELKADREYILSLMWNSDSVRAQAVPVQVRHAGGETNLTINQRSNGNQWNVIGTFQHSATAPIEVRVENRDTEGFVIVDALKCEDTVKDPSGPVTLIEIPVVDYQGEWRKKLLTTAIGR